MTHSLTSQVKYPCRPLWLATLLVILPLPVMAQVSTGTIVGEVSDTKQAAIPQAAVTIKNLDTGIETSSVTSAEGLFTVPNLQTGHYSVEVTAHGFVKSIVQNIQVDVGQQQEVNVELKVGSETAVVIVTSLPLSIDTVSSTVKPVVDEHTIVELPLNGRDWTQLANLQPGVAGVR